MCVRVCVCGNITVILLYSLYYFPLLSLSLFLLLPPTPSSHGAIRAEPRFLVSSSVYNNRFASVFRFSCIQHVQQHHRIRVSSLHYSQIFFGKLFNLCAICTQYGAHTYTTQTAAQNHIRVTPHYIRCV